jgi:hypothetical protein
MPFFAAVDAPPSPDSMKFPVNSLLAGNLASETSSLVTPSSSGESDANHAAPLSSAGPLRVVTMVNGVFRDADLAVPTVAQGGLSSSLVDRPHAGENR